MATMNKSIYDIPAISMSECEVDDTITFIMSNGNYSKGVIKEKYKDEDDLFILRVVTFSSVTYMLKDRFTRISELIKPNNSLDSSKFYYLLCK